MSHEKVKRPTITTTTTLSLSFGDAKAIVLGLGMASAILSQLATSLGEEKSKRLLRQAGAKLRRFTSTIQGELTKAMRAKERREGAQRPKRKATK